MNLLKENIMKIMKINGMNCRDIFSAGGLLNKYTMSSRNFFRKNIRI